MDVTKLIPGETYVITVEDCCVELRTAGEFVRYNFDADGDPDEAVFDSLTIRPMWGAWNAEVAVVASRPNV